MHRFTAHSALQNVKKEQFTIISLTSLLKTIFVNAKILNYLTKHTSALYLVRTLAVFFSARLHWSNINGTKLFEIGRLCWK